MRQKPAMLMEATPDCEVIAENEIPLLTRINGLQYDERNDLYGLARKLRGGFVVCSSPQPSYNSVPLCSLPSRIWAADSSEGILVLLGKDGAVVDMYE